MEARLDKNDNLLLEDNLARNLENIEKNGPAQ